MIKKVPFFFLAVLMVGLMAGCNPKEETIEDSTTDTINTERVCPALKDPVCAELNGEKKTFDNGCEANKAGSKKWTRGECEG